LTNDPLIPYFLLQFRTVPEIFKQLLKYFGTATIRSDCTKLQDSPLGIVYFFSYFLFLFSRIVHVDSNSSVKRNENLRPLEFVM